MEQERKEQEQEEQDKREMREENVKTQLRLMVEQDGIPTTWREYLRDIKDEQGLDVTMKTLENWTKDLRDELEQETVADAEIEDERVEELAEELMRDELFVFGCLSQQKKRNRARKYLQEEHEFDAQEAEAVAAVDCGRDHWPEPVPGSGGGDAGGEEATVSGRSWA